MKRLFHSVCLVVALVTIVNSQAQQILPAEPLRLLTEHNPPGEFRDDTGKITGATVELIRVLQQRLNEPGDIELMPWSRALSIAKSSRNIGLFETVYTTERAPWFKWVGPLKHYTISLYGLKHRVGDDSAQRVLPGKFIACNYRNSATAADIMQLGFAEGRNLVLTSRSGDCLDMLLMQRVDLIAVTEYALQDFVRQTQLAGYQLTKVQQLTERKRYLAFSADVSDTRVNRWQQALEQSYRDGTMRQLYQSVYTETQILRLEQFAAAQ